MANQAVINRGGNYGSFLPQLNGNRLTRTVNNVTENYEYDDADKLLNVKINNNLVKEYTYDACGRLIQVIAPGNQITQLQWDYEDRLIGITYPNQSTNSFAYNPFGARVSKSDSSGTSTYFRAGTSVVSPVLDDGSATYTPGISERRSDSSTFYHSDLKNTVAQTASNETISGTNVYDAFGNLLNYTGDWNGPFAYGGAFGYQTDDDSGLMLLGHRYYDSSTGRFLSRDPTGDGSNWYTYCDSSPLKHYDPTGLIIYTDLVDPLNVKNVKELTDPLDSNLKVKERSAWWNWFFGDMAVVLDSETVWLPTGESPYDFLHSPDKSKIRWYNHEAAHVEQASVLGVFYVPNYFMQWVGAGFSYKNHPMEIAAEARAKAKAYPDRRVPPKRQRPFYDIDQHLPSTKQWFEWLTETRW